MTHRSCSGVGKEQRRHCLPDDIQDAVEATKGAQALQKAPWAGMQLKACYIQNYTQPAKHRIVEDSACSTADEVSRYAAVQQYLY